MYALDHATIATPVGSITIFGGDRWITAVRIDAAGGAPAAASAAAVREAALQLLAWFAGERTGFDVPLAPPTTGRGAALREAMIGVGFGQILSYGSLARRIASSPRAIGQACARNPFPILVPCHRITNADGSPGAYSAGDGSLTKRWLLDFERRDRLLL